MDIFSKHIYGMFEKSKTYFEPQFAASELFCTGGYGPCKSALSIVLACFLDFVDRSFRALLRPPKLFIFYFYVLRFPNRFSYSCTKVTWYKLLVFNVSSDKLRVPNAWTTKVSNQLIHSLLGRKPVLWSRSMPHGTTCPSGSATSPSKCNSFPVTLPAQND